ncbi:Mu transposase C-terminal domain-containing protein [Desulforegula conservatrix]|uniref:Mu transposase C-terminal domain-containing protein n=1 Tax=Desulforegula conservatrix TaxID=153026 RepID=UPI00041EA0E6|nr:Mu transposase C-terminal domain-containing protein [Desulforegula conservatrix]
MKSSYDAKEIAILLGRTRQGILARAAKENWPCEIQGVRGGNMKVFPYKCLPADIKDAMVKAESDRLLESLAPAPVVEESEVSAGAEIIVLHAPKVKLPSPRMPSALDPYNKEASEIHSLKGWQKDTATARLTFVKFLQNHPKSQRQGIIDLLVMQTQGTLPAYLSEIIASANNRSGSNGERGLSERTLKRWASDYAKYGYMGIVPESPNKEVAIPAWAAEFLTLYRKPSKPAINFVLELMAYTGCDNIPSYDQARRFVKNFSRLDIERGRKSPKELRSQKGFVRRSNDGFMPMDIVQMDGHSFKAKVQHPFHGRPFIPEICLAVDNVTKMVIGWSVGLAESAQTVGDCVRHMVTLNDKKPYGGIPAILYTDNGAGNEGKEMTSDMTGLFERLGVLHKTGRPGNPQGRGGIESFNKNVINWARLLETFRGKGMSKDVERSVYLAMDKDVREKGKSDITIAWADFLDFMTQFQTWYNYYHHHSTLPKITDSESGRKRHMTPAERWQQFLDQGWRPEMISEEEYISLKRPRIERKTNRAEINVGTNIYFDKRLEHYHGMQVIVEYDVHDPSKVWVYDHDERLIAIPEWNRNKKAFFPVSMHEQALEKRGIGRMKTALKKVDEIQAETGVRANDALPAPESSPEIEDMRAQLQTDMASDQALPKLETSIRSEEIPDDMFEKWEFWKHLDSAISAGEKFSERLTRFHEYYPSTADYRACRMMDEDAEKIMASGL